MANFGDSGLCCSDKKITVTLLLLGGSLLVKGKAQLVSNQTWLGVVYLLHPCCLDPALPCTCPMKGSSLASPREILAGLSLVLRAEPSPVSMVTRTQSLYPSLAREARPSGQGDENSLQLDGEPPGEGGEE